MARRLYLLFSFISMVVSGFYAARYLSHADNYSYAVTQSALAGVERRIDHALFTLIPRGVDRRAIWAAQVRDALQSSDYELAESYISAAPTLLGGEYKAQYEAALRVKADDISPDALAQDMALAWLDAETAARYRGAMSPSAVAVRNAAEAAGGFLWGRTESLAGLGGSVAADFMLWGDIRDFTQQSWRFLHDEQVDYVIYTLSGVGLGLTVASGASAPVKGAASLLKGAKKAGALSGPYTKVLTGQVKAALPPEVLKRNIEGAIGELTLPQFIDGSAVASLSGAWRRSIDPQAYGILREDLLRIASVYEATSYKATLKLMRHVETPTDLAKLEQISLAGGKKAAVLEKSMGKGILRFAKGSIKWTANIVLPLAGLLAGALLALLSLIPKRSALRFVR